MRAGVLHGQRDLRIEDRPDPAFGPGDLVIEVAYNGLCGTDATEYAKGPMMVPLSKVHPGSGHLGPTTLGHEFIGTVVAAGDQVAHRIGERVACGAGVSCMTCAWCLAGRTNLCERYFTLGLSTHGGLAQYVAAPASICVPIPDGLADVDAALAQPLAVGIHSVKRAQVGEQDTVVLLGVGAIGSFICASLQGHRGPIIAMDIDPERLAVATTLGATSVHCIDPQAGSDELRELVPGGAQVVFETSGVLGAAQRALDVTARGGTTVLVGLNKSAQPLNLADVVLREITVRTTVAHICGSDIPQALSLLTSAQMSRVLPTRVISLDEVVTAGLEPLAAGQAQGKILVDPRNG